MGFDRVLGALAEDGLHARWASLRAADVGAPHGRERLFIIVADPEANTATNGGPQPPQKRRAGGHSVNLQDVIEH